MSQTFPAPEAALPVLAAERLDAYNVALEFQRLAISAVAQGSHGGLRDQLDRASASIALNVAEGAGRSSAPDKARFYAIARGSATECAAILDLLLVRGAIGQAAAQDGRSLLIRIVQMLTRLAARMATLRA
jgi:four helix bundle protein